MNQNQLNPWEEGFDEKLSPGWEQDALDLDFAAYPNLGFQHHLDALEAKGVRRARPCGRLRRLALFCSSHERLPMMLGLYPVYRAQGRLLNWLAALGEEWEGFDNVAARRRELTRIFLRHRAHMHHFMSNRNFRAWSALGNTVTIYRGCGEHNMNGLSWTLDKATAARFPSLSRYRQERPLLLEARVAKSDILAVVLGRGEHEVIIVLPENFPIKVEALPKTNPDTPPPAGD